MEDGTLKKTLILAAMALVALAVPAGASATEWQQEGKPFEGSETIQLHGASAQLVSSVYGTIHCGEYTMDVEIEGSVEGKNSRVTSFGFASPCEYSTGLLAGCAQWSLTNQSVPWSSETVNQSMKISGIGFKLSPINCGQVTFAEGTLTGVPDSSEAMTSMSLNGFIKSGLGYFQLQFGTASVSPSGVWGIG
jgi:hypothetical protein